MDCRFKFVLDKESKFLNEEIIYVDACFSYKNFKGGYTLVFDGHSYGFNIDDELDCISGMSDYVGNLDRYIQCKLSLPTEYEEGYVYLECDDVLAVGCAYTIDIRDNTVYYDRSSNLFQIGVVDNNLPWKRFLRNVYGQIDSNGKWVTVIVSNIDDTDFKTQLEMEKLK